MDKQVDWKTWKIAYILKSCKVNLEHKQLFFLKKRQIYGYSCFILVMYNFSNQTHTYI